ncbi:MAG: hypothetical protein MK137_08095, partial [Rickettsiales bacterium]|nr:hypothetical protein [Rickettsiales bacterium]
MTGLTAVRPVSLQILICSILISLVPTLLYAIDLRLEGEQTSRYSRVYFNGNDTLNFRATARGTVISVVFNENITIVSDNVNETLPDIVRRIRVVDNNQLIITLSDSNFRIRNFIGNGKSGVDLFRTETPSGLQRISPTPVFKQTALASSDENASQTNPTTTSEPPKEGIALIPEGVGRITKNHPIPVAKSPRHERMNKRLKIQRKSDSQFSVLFQQEGDTNTIIFPWRKNVAAAIFVREGVLWIVFNDTADIDYYELETMEAGSLKFLGQRPSSRVTIARLTGDDFNNLKVWKRGRSWYMSFGGEPTGNIHDAVLQEEKIKRIIPIYSADNKKQIIINAGDYSVPAIQVTDPLILDNLRIIPINNLRYVPNTHRMVDLDLLATRQGMVTINKTDNVRIKASHVPQQLFINTPTGHAHRNALENIRAEEETQIITERPRSMIDFTRLRFDDGQELYQNIIEMQRAITFLSDDAKYQYMFELAKLYLANELYQESTNILETIERNQPDFINTPRFKFAKAVALYLNEEYPQVLNILNSIDLENKGLSIQSKEEIDFWKRAAKRRIGFIDTKNKDDVVPIAYDKYTDLFLSTYPPDLLSHFAIESIKEYLDLNQNENASDILNMMTVEEITNPEVRNELLYLLGRYFIQTGEVERGMDFLKDVKADTFDRRNRSQAELLLTQTLYSMNEIPIDETIDRLSQVRV